MTHILSALSESYNKVVENLEDKIDDRENLITTNRIIQNIFVTLLPNWHTHENEESQGMTKGALQEDLIKGYLQKLRKNGA